MNNRPSALAWSEHSIYPLDHRGGFWRNESKTLNIYIYAQIQKLNIRSYKVHELG